MQQPQLHMRSVQLCQLQLRREVRHVRKSGLHLQPLQVRSMRVWSRRDRHLRTAIGT